MESEKRAQWCEEVLKQDVLTLGSRMLGIYTSLVVQHVLSIIISSIISRGNVELIRDTELLWIDWRTRDSTLYMFALAKVLMPPASVP
jgi:hypothetical protein